MAAVNDRSARRRHRPCASTRTGTYPSSMPARRFHVGVSRDGLTLDVADLDERYQQPSFLPVWLAPLRLSAPATMAGAVVRYLRPLWRGSLDTRRSGTVSPSGWWCGRRKDFRVVVTRLPSTSLHHHFGRRQRVLDLGGLGGSGPNRRRSWGSSPAASAASRPSREDDLVADDALQVMGETAGGEQLEQAPPGWRWRWRPDRRTRRVSAATARR